MSFDYSSLALTSKELIDKFGKNVTLTTIVDSGTPYNPTQTPTDTTKKAISVNFKSEDINGSTVQEKDVMFLIYHSSVIDTSSTITDGSVTYSVVRNMAVKPGDTILIQKLHCRS